jgi:hypothetical protein
MAIDPGKLQALAKHAKKGNPFGGGDHDDHGGGQMPPKKGGEGNPALGMLKNIRVQLDKAINALQEHEKGEGEPTDHAGEPRHDDAVDIED